MKKLLLPLTFAFFAGPFAEKSRAQSPCESIVWLENFGAGSPLIAAPSANVNPSYAFSNFGVGPGNYSILNDFFHHSSWHTVAQDHTPSDVGGYFLVIDGLPDQPIFYEKKLAGIVPNADYRFAGWAMNIDLPAFQSDLTFKFSILDAAGAEIAATTTGIMPASAVPKWTEHQLDFNSGPNTSLTLRVIFTATGYDDFAFDDFRLARLGGGAATIGQVEKSLCRGDSLAVGSEIFDENRPNGSVLIPGGAASGCDSTVEVQLFFTDSVLVERLFPLCEGEKITFGGRVFDEKNPSGEFVLPGASGGCDTLVRVNLTFSKSAKGQLDTLLFDGQKLKIGLEIFDEKRLEGQVFFEKGAANGCDSTLAVRVEFVSRAVYFPNAFSPDFDGLNDEFLPFCAAGISKILSLKIFDRWGELVFSNENFEPNAPKTGWDGTFRGQSVAVDVYVFLAEIEFVNGSRERFSGDLTAIR